MPVERNGLERIQSYLLHLLGYLEGVYSSHASEGHGFEEEAGEHDLGVRMQALLYDCGYFDGLHLKEQGLLSVEVQEFIQNVGFAFEVEVIPAGAFKLPFVGNELVLRRKSLNAFMEKAWFIYHAALLSAYGMKPLCIQRQDPLPSGSMEETVRIADAAGKNGERVAAGNSEWTHRFNNHLGGIVSYASLMLDESADPMTRERLLLILESARNALAMLRPASLKTPEAPPS